MTCCMLLSVLYACVWLLYLPQEHAQSLNIFQFTSLNSCITLKEVS